MLYELVAIVMVSALGMLVVRVADPETDGSRLVGEGMLMGIGVATMSMLALSVVGILWTRTSIVSTLAAMALIAILAGRRGKRESVPPPPLAWARWHWGLVFHAVSAALLSGYSVLATLAPMWEFDFVGDWGLKARTFWEVRGLDWQFLEHPLQRAFHPDYPLLLPLSFDLFAVTRDGWNDQTMGVFNLVFALGILLIVYRLVLDETGERTAAAFATMAMLPFAATPWIGIAEGPFVAYGTAGLLLVRRGLMHDAPRSILIGATFLGFAAWTKNEGLTLLVAAGFGMMVDRRSKQLLRFWPAVVIATPWLVLRSLHHLSTDLAVSGVFGRVVAHLREPGVLLSPIARYRIGKSLFWTGIAAGMLFLLRTLLRKERFIFSAVIAQLAFYLGAYLASPHDLNWHVRWSWERLVSHGTLALAYVVISNLLVFLTRTASSPSEIALNAQAQSGV